VKPRRFQRLRQVRNLPHLRANEVRAGLGRVGKTTFKKEAYEAIIPSVGGDWPVDSLRTENRYRHWIQWFRRERLSQQQQQQHGHPDPEFQQFVHEQHELGYQQPEPTRPRLQLVGQQLAERLTKLAATAADSAESEPAKPKPAEPTVNGLVHCKGAPQWRSFLFPPEGRSAKFAFKLVNANERIRQALAPIEALLPQSPRLARGSLALPHFLFRGPHGGGDPVRIGLFAGIHGDEPAGTHALVQVISALHTRPEVATGYELFFYPICNLSGFSKGTRYSESGKDLNREFWKNSSEPEVQVLEREIRRHRFHGLISLHSDDTSPGVYGFVRGAVLTRGLLEPALAAAEKILPRNRQLLIDGFPAENGIISQCYDGILTSPPELDPAPFEIILETPHAAPEELQVKAFVAAIETVLSEYQKLLAFAANL
jgi:murein peptide amidase A